MPLRLAVNTAVFNLRDGLDQMDGRLRTHFSAAFIDSLYPELKKGGKAVAEDEDEDVNDPALDQDGGDQVPPGPQVAREPAGLAGVLRWRVRSSRARFPGTALYWLRLAVESRRQPPQASSSSQRFARRATSSSRARSHIAPGIGTSVRCAGCALLCASRNLASAVIRVHRSRGVRLIDELSSALSPVLFGSGIRLFEGVDAGRVALVLVRAEPSPRVTHLTYAVRKR